MSMILERDAACTLDQAKSEMADKIEQAYTVHTSSAHPTSKSTVVRLQVNIEYTPPLAWLTAQKSPVKTYWSGRDNGFEMAGIGVSDIVAGEDRTNYNSLFNRLNKLLPTDNDDIRYYGGFRFSEENKSTGKSNDVLWKRFGSYRFVIPRFELLCRPDETLLVSNIVFGRGQCEKAEILAELGNIVSLVESPYTEVPRIIARSDNPDKEVWNVMVRAALESFDSSDLEKLVLARQTLFEFSSPLNALQLLQKLKTATPDCYHYCFQFGDTVSNSVAFIGASPERLYERFGQNIRSEAVAGTRPRGRSSEADEVIGRELLSSEKERREHQYVVRSVKEALEQLGCSVSSDDKVFLLKLARLQHLITQFEGELSEGITDADILATMHPTPAVGGYPTDLAIDKIAALEPFDRGWYAGPVGWVGRSAAEFAVGIRSGLVDRNKLLLYAGAGIVKGSNLESEWNEIENKLNSFTKVLTE